MNKKLNCRYVLKFSLFISFLPLAMQLSAQQQACIFKEPLITVDFGSAATPKDVNLSMLKRYDRMHNSCPDDGNYSFASATEDCFNGHWHTISADHTSGDMNGRMMIVNASERPGVFFTINIAGLKPGVTYEFANWIVNVCRSGFECTAIPPLIKVSVSSAGKTIKGFVTGEINPTFEPQWKKYSAEFTLPMDVSAITLQLENQNPGGCGNDFALDDLTLRECVVHIPAQPQPEVVLPPIANKTTPVKMTSPTVVKEKAPEPGPLTRKSSTERTVTAATQRKNVPQLVSLPTPIATRANPVIKQIHIDAGELIVELYDNGQIDGDTVSIFHNNHLLRSRAALSAKAVRFTIQVDKQQPHHELIMVAENLGSIPPNTSLMIITTRRERYEVFISSSEQKNAKILIDLKE